MIAVAIFAQHLRGFARRARKRLSGAFAGEGFASPLVMGRGAAGKGGAGDRGRGGGGGASAGSGGDGGGKGGSTYAHYGPFEVTEGATFTAETRELVYEQSGCTASIRRRTQWGRRMLAFAGPPSRS